MWVCKGHTEQAPGLAVGVRGLLSAAAVASDLVLESRTCGSLLKSGAELLAVGFICTLTRGLGGSGGH